MKCAGTDTPEFEAPGLCCIIGYGNPQRGDDGLGPWVVNQAEKAMPDRDRVFFHTCHQLLPDPVDELAWARSVVFVDATVEILPEGRRWEKVRPSLDVAPYITHSVKPDYFLGLLELIYGRRPEGWLVSIQGDDFEMGQGISPEAKQRARRVVTELIGFVSKED